MRVMKSYYGRTAALAALALLLICGLHSGDSLAYFTTFTMARGSVELHLGAKTELTETVDEMKKTISIQNNGTSDCFVRAKVFAGDEVTITYEGSSKWSRGDDGYYYYSDVLAPGESTEPLTAVVSITKTLNDLKPEDVNVIIIYESTPALYDADGSAGADWSIVIRE